ncbi:hypothetical protein ACTI_56670 [Actinoplanes sp. OR16]|uniref:NACHT domain-containing protein n=1 Tax=Actinoplanes sp. OR16 TaxID=946334 RepID=UPI000F6C6411|nr:NACHT domain-containing protein [Actinoplanes sp. OR16]BBH68982.1 hypothetical protein ACTI_56670 [Actinoplanes sp. OR16]
MPRNHWVRLAAGSAGLLIVLASLAVWLLSAGDDVLDSADKLAGVGGLVVGSLGLGIAVIGRPAGESGAGPTADRLAALVSRQWSAEAHLRLLDRPGPIPVRWRSTARRVGAAPAEVLAGAVGGRPIGLRLHHDVTGISETFTALPLGQLVILGGPGAGKTTALLELTLQLLDGRRPGDRVPVLLNLAAWGDARDLEQWLIARITDEYGHVLGRSAIADLVAAGSVLPLLDGLDELPQQTRKRVFKALNREYSRHGAVVVACRSRDFQRIVRAAGTPLGRAAVVELRPLSPDDLRPFLEAGQIDGATRWGPVLDQVTRQPDGALAAALSTPLMAYLARASYGRVDARPADLTEFTDAHDIERRLIASYLPALYGNATPRTRRWLAFLAGHLTATGRAEIRWWELRRAVPRWNVLSAVAFGLGAILTAWLVSLPSWYYGSNLVPLLAAAGLAGGYLHGRREPGTPGVAYLSVPIVIVALGIAAIFPSVAAGAGALILPAAFVAGLGAVRPLPRRGRIASRFAQAYLLSTIVLIGTVGLTHLSTGLGFDDGTIVFTGLALCAGFFTALTYTDSETHFPIPTGSMIGAACVLAGITELLSLQAALLSVAFNLAAGGMAWVSATTPLHGVRPRLWPAVGWALGAAILVGTVTLMFGAVMGGGALLAAAPISLFLGGITGAVIGLVRLFKRGQQEMAVTSPRAGLTAGRTAVLGIALTVAAALYAASLVTTYRCIFFAVILLGVACASIASPWPQFLLARTALALTGRLPWRLMRFLDDAHRRGVLRQVGSVHQFRHDVLQRHLAAEVRDGG